jgi:hypothetical protein
MFWTIASGVFYYVFPSVADIAVYIFVKTLVNRIL